MSGVNKTGEGSGFQIGGFDSAHQGTVTPDSVAGNSGNVVDAGALQNQHQKFHDLAGKNAVSLVKYFETPNLPDLEAERFIDPKEGDLDPVMAAYINGDISGYDPISGALATVTSFGSDFDNYAAIDAAIDAAPTSPLADLYDTPLDNLGTEEFAMNAFGPLYDGIANLSTRRNS